MILQKKPATENSPPGMHSSHPILDAPKIFRCICSLGQICDKP